MHVNRLCRGSYIQGHFTKVTDPNGEILSRNPGAIDDAPLEFPFSYEHVHDAVTAARQAFSSWRRLSAGERAGSLTRYRDLIKAKAEELATQISFEVGKPLWESRLEITATLNLLEHFLGVARQIKGQQELELTPPGSRGLVRFFSRGVMAVIYPAGQPFFTPHLHLVPALLYGNTVVLKSTSHAPATAQCLAELSHDAGFPAGVFNLIHGDAEASRRLVAHSGVDGILFTGPYETGFKIKKATLSDYWKILVAEAGGKNGLLIWDDCDYEKALHDALLASFITSGQRCHSTSRILIHQKLYDRFTTDFHELAKKCTVGYAFSESGPASFMGPLVSELAVENYIRYQGIAVREGCEEIMRGKTLEREHRGYYVSPSIHAVKNPNPKSVYQKSEMYAPNVALYRVGDLLEAAEILNLPQHGLVASIYCGAQETYLRLAEEVKVGLLHWNRMTIEPSYALPSGGLKKSGNSRPMGAYSQYQCTYLVASLEKTGETPDAIPAAMPRLHS